MIKDAVSKIWTATMGSANEHYLEKELYQLVREDRSIFDFLQGGSLDGLWYWDLEKPEHEWINGEFWRLFGYDPAEMPHLASAWQDIIFQEDLQVATENFQKHCEDKNHAYDQIVRYRHRNGSTVWVRCRGIAIRKKDGTPIRMLGAHIDVTALKMAEQRLDMRNRELESTNRDLSEFAYSASHDLRSPLNTLEGLITVLKEDYLPALDESGQEVIGMIDQVCGRLQELTGSVLYLADVTQSNHEFTQVNSNRLVDEICVNLSSLIKEHSATILYKNLPIIKANDNILGRVFQNLIENAIKFHREGRAPKITISARENGNEVVFSVKDNGVGIAEDQVEKVFDLFNHTRGSGKRRGVGLGLSLCRKIVELHGGRIWVEPGVGPGATISFSLNTSLSR